MRRICLLLPACSSAETSSPRPGAAAQQGAAIDLRYTETFEIRFGDELVGYLASEARPRRRAGRPRLPPAPR
jgi:hypothetical protein